MIERLLVVVGAAAGVPRDAVTADTLFADLGLDSLDRLGLLYDIDQEFGVWIPDAEASDLTTVAALAARLRQEIHP